MIKLLQTYVAGNGFKVSLKVAEKGSPEVWFQDRNVSDTVTAFEFAPRVNSLGDMAWAATFGASTKASVSSNDVFLNGRVVATEVPVQDIALTDTHLAWISTTGNRTQITFLDLVTEELTIRTVDFAADRIRVSDGKFVMVGLDTMTGDAASAVLTPDQPPVVTWHGGAAIQLTGPSLTPMVVEIEGDAAAMALLNAMSLIYDDTQEALALITEDTGRVNNMFVPRLEALIALARATGDPELEARTAEAALNAIRQADANGVYYSTRYSLDDTPAAWSMHAAMLNGTALQAAEWMSAEERAEVLAVAEAAYAYFESDWVDGAYLITPHSGVDFDGVIQPNNMQAVMGTFAVQLYEATGEQQYLDRANAIFDLLAPELFEYQGTNVFHYWGELFRAGWSEGQFDSDSRPTYPPTESTLYDDVYHAALVIRFFEDIARVRGDTPLLDATALFDLVRLAPYEFSGFLNGGPSGLDWMPPWPSADQMLDLATRPFPTTLGVYDEGMHISAVAGAAARLAGGGVGSVTVTLRDPSTWEVIDTVVLTGASEVVDWVQNLESAYAPAPDDGVTFGSAAADALNGSPDDDVIRGLDGDDVLMLGDGADLGFGDLGDDTIDGGAGDDTLAGGENDDVLSGGDGADRLYGQAGIDRLLGGGGDDLLVGGEGADDLDGGDGADRLFGGTGADVLSGGAGTDRLYGGEGDDQLDVGAAVPGQFQYMTGDGGNDTYLYSKASGLAYIASSEGAGAGLADQVVFSGLNVGDITLAWQDYRGDYPAEGLALMIQWSDGEASGQLQIANEGRHIESFRFADGAVFNTLQLTAAAGGSHVSGATADLIQGGAGTDRIYAGDGDDRLDAGAGVAGEFQALSGEGGNDTYVYGKASGGVYIGSSEGAGAGIADEVVFVDLNVGEITLGWQDYRGDYPAEGLALIIQWFDGEASGQLQIANEGRHIESFRFADGAVFNTLQLTAAAGGSHVSGATADLILGGAGTDRIFAGAGDDRLDAGAGVAGVFQYLSGQSGNDTYVYGRVSGLVYIDSSEGAGTGAADQVVFTDLNIGDVSLGWQDYRNDYPAEGRALMIQWSNGQTSGQLQIANEGRHIETFRFADGTVVTIDQLLAGFSGSEASLPEIWPSAHDAAEFGSGDADAFLLWETPDARRDSLRDAVRGEFLDIKGNYRVDDAVGLRLHHQSFDPSPVAAWEGLGGPDGPDAFISFPAEPVAAERTPDHWDEVAAAGPEVILVGGEGSPPASADLPLVLDPGTPPDPWS